jgi:ankyrin repeat protein
MPSVPRRAGNSGSSSNEFRADVVKPGLRDLLDAVRDGDRARVIDLLSEDYSLASERADNGDSPLMLSLYYGRDEITAIILSRSPEINFFEAVALGELGEVRRLVHEQPELLHAYSFDGFTGLHLAVFFGHEEIAGLLIDKGADVDAIAANVSFARNATPLHSAVAADKNALVRLLIGRGARVNATQDGGFTPLHGAAANGNDDIVDALLEAGADVSRVTNENKSASALARERGHDVLANRLAERERT